MKDFFRSSRMTYSRSVRFLSALFLFLVLPLQMSAATVAETLKTADDTAVSRGEFIRSAVTVLGIPLKAEGTLPYKRPVAKTLLPYVRAANDLSALTTFGKDLAPARSITRGEAVELLVALQKLSPSGVELRFSDASSDSALGKAVQVAVERNWIAPIRRGLFGVDRVLTGREARLLLRKATGDTTLEQGTGELKIPSVIVRVKMKEKVGLPKDDVLRAVWQLLNEKYLYTDKIDASDAGYRAVESLVQSLKDPYTVFLRPQPAQEFQNQINSEISGIGAQVEYHDNALTVVSPITGSPAEKAGVRGGDRILEVDGKTLAGLTLVEAVNKIRGPKGTTVTLRILRDGSEFDLKVERDTIKVPEIHISWQGSVAVVKLTQFGQTTDRELRSLMLDVQKQDPKGIILDVRNNPGGLLHAAEIVVSNFLPVGSGVANIVSKDEEYLEVTTDGPTINETVPMVMLVNKGSASASEIVAGALQDAGRAVILGETTFGKGTVQQVLEFSDGSNLKLTIAEWLTPKRRKINGIGITPDVAVAPSEGRDEQLLRAIDLLRYK